MEGIDLFEAMRTQRSVRSFTDETVPQDAVERILEAASWAPNATNRQLWEFIVVRDPAVKHGLGEIYRRSMELLVESMPARVVRPDPRTEVRGMVASVEQLAQTLASVPVIIVVGYDRAGMPYTTDGVFKAFTDETVYTGVMPAVQNLMLAARALGLGTCLTTVANVQEGKVKELLGVPPAVQLVCLLPLGYPDGKLRGFPPVKRIPVQERVHNDRW